ncbi:MAG: hypothetical protein A3H91_03215 [Gammaproteobacteria bacterium RIFCSPLOWO2_02_FULL_61_13]|nr:MAG: hypothetical protein A3H91_03215 [Gammaproteobacteria bacterium RIFCSPLOWO2_02_FULL_61_13]
MSTNLPADGHAAGVARPGRSSRPWVGMAFLVALIALAAGAWSLQELRQVKSRTENLAMELRRAGDRMEAAARESADLRAQVGELSNHNVGVDRTLAETRAALNQVVQSNGNVDFALAEVEYLLILAEQRLTLMQDVETAKGALQAVDNRLAGLQAPGLDAVRGQINADLLRLAQVPVIDYSRWIEELGELTTGAKTLPLRTAAQAVAEATTDGASPAQGWRGFLHAVWQELRDTVVVTRTAAELSPFPAEQHYVVQNLLLRIETARLALLRRDSRALHDAAASTTDWLQRWFDGGDPRVRNALNRLQVLATLDPAPPLPDITSSLETLRALTRERAAPASPGPAPAPVP